MTEVFTPGSLARLTCSAPELSAPGTRRHPAGFEFEVEDFVSADEAENGVAFYWGSAGGGMNNVTVAADAVELVRSADDMAARKIPTAKTLVDAVGIEMLGSFDGFQTYAADPDGPDAREIYGRTDEGLTFGFRVRVESVWRTDD